MDFSGAGSSLGRSASRLTILAHLFGILTIILMLVWLLHYREGIEYDSDNAARVFNVHPFLMVCAFVFLTGEALMAYKTVIGNHYLQKVVHMMLHVVGMVLGIVGICAAFKFHDMVKAEDMVTLHSWIGLSTFILVGLQWLFGFSTYFFPQASTGMKGRMLPWHVNGGRALLYMAVATALTGLMQKATIQGQDSHAESRLINFTGLFILLFGVTVDLSVGLGRYA